MDEKENKVGFYEKIIEEDRKKTQKEKMAKESSLAFADKTVADFLALPDDARVELIDGVFYDMAPIRYDHACIITLLLTELWNYTQKNEDTAYPFTFPTAVQLDQIGKTVVRPDVFVVRDRTKVSEKGFFYAPDLVVEVVSPSNWSIDAIKKWSKYKQAGVREYWTIFPEDLTVTVVYFEGKEEPVDYSFHDKIPVKIWDGKCVVDFEEIYQKAKYFLGHYTDQVACLREKERAWERVRNDVLRVPNEDGLIGDKTLADYLALPDDVRIEMIDGVFYEMAWPSFAHQAIVGELITWFYNYIKPNREFWSIVYGVDVQLDQDDKTIVRPDIIATCDMEKIHYERLYGAPDLVVEIVSPCNWQMDVNLKKAKYEAAGVREYWMVFPEDQKVTVCDFEGKAQDVYYTFRDKIPVRIWDEKCVVDFEEIYQEVKSFIEPSEQ